MASPATPPASSPATSGTGNPTSKAWPKPRPARLTSGWWPSLPFYKWALAQNLVTRDPTAGIATIRLAARQPQSLSTKALRRLLRAVHNGGSSRDVAIIELLASAGLWVGGAAATAAGRYCPG
jgi:hypothetical protein